MNTCTHVYGVKDGHAKGPLITCAGLPDSFAARAHDLAWVGLPPFDSYRHAPRPEPVVEEKP